MTAADRGAALRDSSAWLIATACILVSMAVPVVHGDVAARIGVPHAFQAGTIVMLLCAIVAIRWWPRPYDISSARVMPVFHAAGALAAFACCLWTASRLVPAIFAGPLDVNRGDMLVLVESGAKELIAGHMPYHMYHLPWDAPLSYGPTLWPCLPTVAGSRLSIRFSVSVPRPIDRRPIPIHQLGARTSRSPRGLPWSLNMTKTIASCMNVHPGLVMSCCIPA
jgi:hypothetical protein